MNKKVMVGWMCAGVLALGAGCVVMKGGTAGGAEPGTRAYFEQKIRGAYALDRGELVPIAALQGRPGLVRSSLSRPLPPGMPRLPSAPPAGALWVEGRVLQVLSNNLAVIGKAVTNVSGAVTFPRSCLVTLAGDRQPLAAGACLRLLAVSDGWYTYEDGSGDGTLTAYREVPAPTYEEYRRIYERDCQSAPCEPLLSVARATNAVPQAAVPSQPTAGETQPTAPQSYMARLQMQRLVREQRAHPSPGTFGDYTYATNAAGEAAITGFNKDYTGALAITNAVDGYPVTGLKDKAFLNCTNLTGVTIPASVTRIGEAAFLGCSDLGSILVDVLNPAYSSSADGVLFDAGKTRLVCYPQGKAGDYAIPGRVANIGSCAFRDCANLTGVTIPNSVTRIEGGAFWGCSALTSVAIPASVTDVAPWAFAGCNRLNAIRVDDANPAYSSTADGVVFNKEKTRLIRYPGGRTGDYAIPDKVTSIGYNAFQGCTNLTRITIPNSVTSIDREAFHDCTRLTCVTMLDGLSVIGYEAFHGCTNLTDVTIPNSVTCIDGWAFADCRKLASVTIPDNVSRVGDWAFIGCGNLTHVTFGVNVTNIDGSAFGYSTNLTSVYFQGNAPNNIWSFSGHNKLTVYYRPGTAGWGKEFGGRPTKESEEKR